MQKDSKIYVAGHRGMVGSAIVRELERQGYTNIITRTHKELDLTPLFTPHGRMAVKNWNSWAAVASIHAWHHSLCQRTAC